MDANASLQHSLTLACRWILNRRTGRLEAHWERKTPVKREDVLRHFTPPNRA